MSDFTMMHVFFIVTTVAVVIVSVLLTAAVYYVVRILRTIDKLSLSALAEAALLREDIADLRENVRTEGVKWKSFSEFGRKFAGRFMGKDIKK